LGSLNMLQVPQQIEFRAPGHVVETSVFRGPDDIDYHVFGPHLVTTLLELWLRKPFDGEIYIYSSKVNWDRIV
jgi:hypothetical protein